jgi:hypothetical protein
MLGRLGNAVQKWKGGQPSQSGHPAVSRARDEKKLAEVKAVLERLQRISADGSGDLPAHEAEIQTPKPDGPQAGTGASQTRGNPGLLVAAAGGALVLMAVAGFVTWRSTSEAPRTGAALNLGDERDRHTAALPKPAVTLPTVPSPAAIAPAPPPDSADVGLLGQAEKLMEAGKIRDARLLLLDGLADRSPEAALMLARSYDPNHLRSISAADAGPDVAEAERWYRVWHANAVASGLRMEPERLDRIIRSMR